MLAGLRHLRVQLAWVVGLLRLLCRLVLLRRLCRVGCLLRRWRSVLLGVRLLVLRLLAHRRNPESGRLGEPSPLALAALDIERDCHFLADRKHRLVLVNPVRAE